MSNKMLKTQTKIGFWRKFFTWFGRHKIVAMFSVLVLAAALFLAGSWIVWQVQIHSERERFNQAGSDVKSWSDQSVAMGSVRFRHYCFYESSTTEFVRGQRLCVIRADVTDVGLTRADAIESVHNLKSLLEKKGFELTNDTRSKDGNSLAVYSFNDQKIGCSLDSEYYDEKSTANVRLAEAPKTGQALFAQLVCSGTTNAEYFPVASN